MNIEIRKYRMMQRLMHIDREKVLDALEKLLNIEEEEENQLTAELNQRIENYHSNPDDLLDWDEVKSLL